MIVSALLWTLLSGLPGEDPTAEPRLYDRYVECAAVSYLGYQMSTRSGAASTGAGLAGGFETFMMAAYPEGRPLGKSPDVVRSEIFSRVREKGQAFAKLANSDQAPTRIHDEITSCSTDYARLLKRGQDQALGARK